MQPSVLYCRLHANTPTAGLREFQALECDLANFPLQRFEMRTGKNEKFYLTILSLMMTIAQNGLDSVLAWNDS